MTYLISWVCGVQQGYLVSRAGTSQCHLLHRVRGILQSESISESRWLVTLSLSQLSYHISVHLSEPCLPQEELSDHIRAILIKATLIRLGLLDYISTPLGRVEWH
jgi:hypothetical protein